MAKRIVPQQLGEVKNLADFNDSLLQLASALNPGHIAKMGPKEVKAQFLSFNKEVEKTVILAGKYLLAHAEKKDVPNAMSTIFFFTKQYLGHLERIEAILKKEPVEIRALVTEFNLQFEDLAPFLSAIEGTEPGLLKKIKNSGENRDALLRLLKVTAKSAKHTSEGFSALVSSAEKLFLALERDARFVSYASHPQGVPNSTFNPASAWIAFYFVLSQLYYLMYNFSFGPDVAGNHTLRT